VDGSLVAGLFWIALKWLMLCFFMPLSWPFTKVWTLFRGFLFSPRGVTWHDAPYMQLLVIQGLLAGSSALPVVYGILDGRSYASPLAKRERESVCTIRICVHIFCMCVCMRQPNSV